MDGVGQAIPYLVLRNGDLPELRRLVSAGFDIHAYGEACLWLAVHNGHLGLVRYAVELGAGTRAAAKYASRLGRGPIVRYLVGHDAANVRECLFEASMAGHLELVRYAVEERGVSANERCVW